MKNTEKSSPPSQPSQEPREGEITRREALKVIAATGCALAASTLLPEGWTKSGVKMGTLPSHARPNQDIALSNAWLSFVSAPFYYTGGVDYVDPGCGVEDTATLSISTSCGQIMFSEMLNSAMVHRTGGSCNGSITLPLVGLVDNMNCCDGLRYFSLSTENRTSNLESCVPVHNQAFAPAIFKGTTINS